MQWLIDLLIERILQDINGINSIAINASEDIVAGYNWLKSGDRDAVMGALSADNPRWLILTPEIHPLTSKLALDTDFVYIVSGVSSHGTARIRDDGGGDTLFEQTCDTTRLIGFSLENTGSASDDRAFWIDATDNSDSVYRHLVFKTAWGGPPSSTVWGESNVDGLWEFITCESRGFLRMHNSSDLPGTFRYITLKAAGNFVLTGAGDAPGLFEYIDGGTNGILTGASGTNSGTFRFITVGTGSFRGECSGDFHYCNAGDNSFSGLCSGNFYFCTAGNNSFAYEAEFSGFAFCCTAGDDSFGGADAVGDVGATFTGSAYNCIATLRSFGGSIVSTGCAGYLKNCTCTNGVTAFHAIAGCIVEDSRIEILDGGAGKEGVMLNGDAGVPKFFNTTILCTGSSFKGIAGNPRNAKIAHCRVNTAFDVNVTNLIAAPNNVIDAAVA